MWIYFLTMKTKRSFEFGRRKYMLHFHTVNDNRKIHIGFFCLASCYALTSRKLLLCIFKASSLFWFIHWSVWIEGDTESNDIWLWLYSCVFSSPYICPWLVLVFVVCISNIIVFNIPDNSISPLGEVIRLSIWEYKPTKLMY